MTLTEIRRSKDMALGELARKVNLGSAVMSRIERGREYPPDSVVSDIAIALTITPEQVRAALPTKEQADAEDDLLLDTLKAISAVSSDAKALGLKRGNGGAREIECPICKGKLRYSVASSNGHIWGQCSTAGCVRWMQ